MKRGFLLFMAIAYACITSAQQYAFNDYIGTWQYTNGDTIFTIRLVEGSLVFRSEHLKHLKLNTKIVCGGYSLSIKDKVTDNYLEDIHSQWIAEDSKKGSDQHIYIRGGYHDFMNKPSLITFVFYDQKKNHFDGEGILGGVMKLMNSSKLHWTLDEKEGIWYATEGSEDWVEVKPVGFSVPTDAIMTKVDE